MTGAAPHIAYSIDAARTLKQKSNLREEPFLVVNPDDVVLFSGWAFDPARSEAPPVFARIDGAAIPATVVRRPDVASVHGPAAANAGFSVAIAVEAFSKPILSVDLAYGSSNGAMFGFDQRQIVVFRPALAERLDAIFIDAVHDLSNDVVQRGGGVFPAGATLGVEGWGWARAIADQPFNVAAIVARGRVYQGTYRIVREGREIGFFAQIPTRCIAYGATELRARLFSGNGASVESLQAYPLRITGTDG